MADNGWRETTVGVLCGEGVLHTQTGPFGSQLHSYDYVPSGVPVVPTEGIGRRRLLTEGIPEVAEETAARLSRHRLKAGDILFARRGVQATGLSAIVTKGQEGWLCGTGAILLRIKGKAVDPEFLSFLLSAEESVLWLKQHAVGAVMPNLNEGVIRQIPLRLPPFAEQKAIAAVLGALDDKIELNRRMDTTLEAMARTLFQSWFVDFDPVRDKLEGRPTVLDPATVALFPDSFEYRDGKRIPTLWEIKSIADVTERVTKGDTPRNTAMEAASSDEPLVRMLRVNAITELGEILYDKLEYIPESIHLGKSRRSILQENDILYTNAGTIGRVAFVQRDLLPANTNQAIAIVRPDASKVPPGFLFMLMRQPGFQEVLHYDVVQAVQANLALGKISDAKSVFPPANVLPKMFAPIQCLLNRIWTNRRQSQTLANLRDSLLPKLLSGELSVREMLNKSEG